MSRDLEESQGRVQSLFLLLIVDSFINHPFALESGKYQIFEIPPPVMGIFQNTTMTTFYWYVIYGGPIREDTIHMRLHLFWCLVGTLIISGCQGSGHTINFDPRALASPSAKMGTQPDMVT